ncbi:MAG: hypothetical protein ABL984_15300 [Pyrinomonadaceae bacterium]
MKARISVECLALLSISLFGVLSVGSQSSADKDARLIDSFGPAPNGHIRGVLDLFLAELANNPEATGIAYIHGSPAEIASRKRLIQNHLGFRKFDPSRVSFVAGRDIGSVRTDLWLVPRGAPEPEIKPEAWVFREIGRARKAVLVRSMNAVINESFRLEGHQTYIINYGTPAQVAQRERWIRNAITFRRFDSFRITLVNGGHGPVRTVMWLVPPGAANPTP